MLILFETPAGYAIFKVLNEKKLSNIDNIYNYFEDESKASELSIIILKLIYMIFLVLN